MTSIRVGSSDEWTDGSRFPHPSGSVETVAVDGALEVLVPAAVSQLFLQAFRVLRPDGQLHIRLPDFEAILRAWRRGDSRQSRAVDEFCTVEHDDRVDAPALDPDLVRTTLDTNTPFRASVDLRRAAIDRAMRVRFRRQNAYSADELERTLALTGFRVERAEIAADTRLHVVARPIELEGAEAFRAGLWSEAVAGLKAAAARDPDLPARHYRLLYHVLIEAARADYSQTPAAREESFERLGYTSGRLDAKKVERLVRALANAPRRQLEIEDYTPDFVHNPDLNERDLGEINASHTFVALGAEELALAEPLIEELRAPLEACLRAPFRVVNVRCWTTHTKAIATQTNDWHNDEGFPADVLKVMVYLSPASARTGTTAVAVGKDCRRIIAEGPPGTFLIFKNYALTHRGVMPTEGERLIMEVTTVPSLRSSTKPVFAGFNAEFPKVPW
jgi:hypothetical protein